MRRILTVFWSGILAAFAMAGPGLAHSLDYVENQLTAKGAFFQPFDRAAPEFELRDSTGNTVAAAGFTGKIIILYFTNIPCRTACPGQASRLAEIQSMVNISPMRDLVQFIGIGTEPNPASLDTVRNYADGLGVDPSNWVFLTNRPGRPSAVRRLMAAFGHDAAAPAENTVTHIIDTKGRWRANFNGLDFQSIDLVVYINALINFGYGVSDGH